MSRIEFDIIIKEILEETIDIHEIPLDVLDVIINVAILESELLGNDELLNQLDSLGVWIDVEEELLK